MRPYYDNAGITIYHGDARTILHTLGSSDLVLTDPPYGLGERWQGGTWGAAPEYTDARRWDIAIDDAFMAEVIAKGKNAIVWGGNYYALPPCRGILAWIKRNAVLTMSDLEIAWTTFDRPAKAWSSRVNPDGKHLHPTAKPLGLMTWCIRTSGECETVIDPFMGSGTTLRAAKDLGVKAVGIEIEERYCEIAARRLAQEVFDFDEKGGIQWKPS